VQQGWKKGVWGLGNLLGNIGFGKAGLSFLSSAKPNEAAEQIDSTQATEATIDPSETFSPGDSQKPCKGVTDVLHPAQTANDKVDAVKMEGKGNADQKLANCDQFSSNATSSSKCNAITISGDTVDHMPLSDLRTIAAAARPPTPMAGCAGNFKKESQSVAPQLPLAQRFAKKEDKVAEETISPIERGMLPRPALAQKQENFAEETIPLIQRLLARGAVPPSTTKENCSPPLSQVSSSVAKESRSSVARESHETHLPSVKRQRLSSEVVDLMDSSQ